MFGFKRNTCDCIKRQQKYIDTVDTLKIEIEQLKEEKLRAYSDLEKLKLDKKIEIEDIKHMQKLLDEKKKLQQERNKFEAEKAASEKIDKIKDTYKDKLENDLIERQKDIQQLYSNIMQALPNVNVRLKGDV